MHTKWRMFVSMKLLHVFAATIAIYHDIWTAAIGATFVHSTVLRNEAAQLSQDRTVPSFTV